MRIKYTYICDNSYHSTFPKFISLINHFGLKAPTGHLSVSISPGTSFPKQFPFSSSTGS